MTEKQSTADPLGLQDVFDSDQKRKQRKHSGRKTITVREYLPLVLADPLLAQNAPSRLLEAIEAKGIEKVSERDRLMFSIADTPAIRYKAFDKLYGLEVPIIKVMQYLEAGKEHLSTGKQILLLYGPTASGKSTFATTLKRLLEGYAIRPVFQIKGCKLQEDPLHLIPRYMREHVAIRPESCEECQDALAQSKPIPDGHLHLGVTIEGDLCVQCRNTLNLPKSKGGKYLDEDGTLRWWEYPVETFTFSIQGGRGIGTFEPSDEKTQDIGQLVGREDIQKLSLGGPDDPESYALCGEMEKGNRGMVEFREALKLKPEFLYVWISAAEEKEIKLQGASFPPIPVDEVLLGHTNPVEFKKFSADQKNEAIHDRVFAVAFPYPVRIKDELATYNKLIREESNFTTMKKCHIAPGALELAALFGVMTRVSDSGLGVSRLDKVKVLNGDRALNELKDKEMNPIDERALLKEGQSHTEDIVKNDGMHGVSPRDVLAAINTKLVQNKGGCLTPLSVIRALKDVFNHRMGYEPQNILEFHGLLEDKTDGGSVYNEYKRFVLKAVKKAFLGGASGEMVGKLYAEYREAVQQDRGKKRKHIRDISQTPTDELGNPIEPDSRLMESIERHISPHLDEEAVKVFRGEFLEYHGSADEPYPMVLKACEEKVLADSADNLTIVLSADKVLSGEQSQLAKSMFAELEHSGFCTICAQETTKNARKFIREE